MEYAGKIVISITDPILVTYSGSSYVTYKLAGVDQKGSFENKRRYRDFFLLRQKLVERWPGLYIPPISSKKATGNTQERFVCFRKKFLDYFCQKIAQREYLYYSEPFQAFIRAQAQFQTAIKILPSIQYENLLTIYEKNFTELTQSITAAELQLSTQADYLFLKSAEKRLQKLRDNYKAVVQAKRQYDNQFRTIFLICLDSVFGKALSNFEENFLLNYVENDRSKLFLKSNDEFESKIQKYKEYTKNNILEEYVEGISYQLRQMRAFKQAIETRKSVQDMKSKNETKIKQSLQEIEKLKGGKTTFKSIFASGSKEEQIKRTQESLEKLNKLQEVLTNIIFLMNASIYTELEHYKTNRAQEYKNDIREMNKKQIKEMSVYGEVLGVVLCDRPDLKSNEEEMKEKQEMEKQEEEEEYVEENDEN